MFIEINIFFSAVRQRHYTQDMAPAHFILLPFTPIIAFRSPAWQDGQASKHPGASRLRRNWFFCNDEL